MDGTGRVDGKDGLFARLKIHPSPGFVAHGPDDHGWMVLIPLHQPYLPVHICRSPPGILRQHIPGAMRFQVGFIDDIKTILITKPVPCRIVGIMTGPHGIDVVLLHELDIPDHRGQRDSLPVHRMNLVSVDPLEQHRLPIDKEPAVPDLHLAEAELRAGAFYDAAFAVL